MLPTQKPEAPNFYLFRAGRRVGNCRRSNRVVVVGNVGNVRKRID